VETAGASYSSANLINLDSAGAVTLDDAGTRRTPGRLIELRREGRSLPPLLARDFALLTNGDRIPLEQGAATVLENNRLLLAPAKTLPGAPRSLSLYAPHVVAVFWSLPSGVDDAGVFFTDLQHRTRKRDAIYLKNGDRIEGAVIALSAKTGCVSINNDRKTQTPIDQIAGIAWNTERQAKLRSRKFYYRAILTGGARVNLVELQFDEKARRWQGKTQFDLALDLPEDAVLGLDERQGQAVELADLTPTRYEHRPYLGAAWPLGLDRSLGGRPLQLGGSTFEKGLAAHASCSITYKLDGLYQQFDSVVGIDAEHSPRGRARVAISLDGKRTDLSAGKELTARTPPLPVRIDVRSVRAMTLIVEAGAFGDVQAEVVWAKARLVKK
jgi:NPCBM/NEW2 domain